MWKPQGMYASFLINQPILFQGKDALNGLMNIPCSKVSVIHGTSLTDDVKEKIKKLFKKKIVYFNQRSWEGEPDIDSLSDTLKEIECQQPDVIVAIGGGAVIDGAKLCRLFYEYPSFELGVTRINQLYFSSRFIAVPTTIGSGAECSSAAVYLNKIKQKKEMIVCHDMQPEAVVLEPDLVAGATYRLLVASGVDAMAHIIEGYVSNVNNLLADINAETGLRILYEEFFNFEVEEMDFARLQYAGYLGGLVQNHCIVGAAHGIAHQLTEYGYSHGQAVSLLLPAVIKANCRNSMVLARYEKLCKNAGAINVANLLNNIEIIVNNSGIGLMRGKLKDILQTKIEDDLFVENIVMDQGAKGNPIRIDKEYLRNVIMAL